MKTSLTALITGAAILTTFPAHATSVSAHAGFNGDGYDDLVIGIPDENVDGEISAGAVNVLYGTAKGL